MFEEEDGLTPADRELETALRSLRPTPASLNLAATALVISHRSADTRRRRWQMAAAAATIILGGGLWIGSRSNEQLLDRSNRNAPTRDPNLIAVRISLDSPTLLTYHQALGRSPAELEHLLDEQSTTFAGPNVPFTHGSLLTLWNAKLQTSQGAM